MIRTILAELFDTGVSNIAALVWRESSNEYPSKEVAYADLRNLDSRCSGKQFVVPFGFPEKTEFTNAVDDEVQAVVWTLQPPAPNDGFETVVNKSQGNGPIWESPPIGMEWFAHPTVEIGEQVYVLVARPTANNSFRAIRIMYT